MNLVAGINCNYNLPKVEVVSRINNPECDELTASTETALGQPPESVLTFYVRL